MPLRFRLVCSMNVKPLLAKMRTIGLLKCRITVRAISESRKPSRWLANYSSEYFRNNSKYASLFRFSGNKSSIVDCQSSKENDTSQKVQEMFKHFGKLKTNYQRMKYDEECVKLFSRNISLSSTFSFLFAWHSLAGSNVFDTGFYKSVVRVWGCEACRCTVVEIISMLYFLGQMKEPPGDLIKEIYKRIEELRSELSFVEWTIVCQNFFVMGVKLSPVVAQEVLNKTVCLLPNVNSRQLISILKALRQCQHPIQGLLPPLSTFILQNCHNFMFVECVHFLATYANAGSYDSEVFDRIETHVFEKPLPELLPMPRSRDLQRLHPNVRARSKDIARFLWAMAHTRHELDPQNLEFLLVTLSRKVFEGGFVDSPHKLVDCLQSLIFYGCYPESLLTRAFSDEFVKTCLNMGKVKPHHQLFFVSLSTEIEFPTYRGCRISDKYIPILGKSLKRFLFSELASRKGLMELPILLKNCYNVDDSKVKCTSLLPHIPLYGVVVKVQPPFEFSSFDLENGTPLNRLSSGVVDLKDFVSFEVLDDTVVIGGQPNGLLATKIRQMEKLGCKVLTLSTDAIMQLTRLSREQLKDGLNDILFGSSTYR